MRNAIYAQSGGVTAVINATACGVIETANQHRDRIGRVYGAVNGIVGVLREEFINTRRESRSVIASLKEMPGGVFGSCRYKLKVESVEDEDANRIFDVFRAHNIGYFFYNGGGDSQDTTNKIDQLSKKFGYPVTCIGIPKTVDNDLPVTDTCPGFGSVAKYVAVSVGEAALDVKSMCETSTKVFILEVMGRHTGWIAAAAGLAGEGTDDPPHVILFPEVPFERKTFIRKIKTVIDRNGYCVIVASEGTRYSDGQFLSQFGEMDSFGHVQLGGAGSVLAAMIQKDLRLKYHFAVADYLQRSARHIASATDVAQAYAVGRGAVERALVGDSGVMITVQRVQERPYKWQTSTVKLKAVVSTERKLPRSFITRNGFGITAKARRYLLPLIQGEAFPTFKSGLPVYRPMRMERVCKQLPPYEL